MRSMQTRVKLGLGLAAASLLLGGSSPSRPDAGPEATLRRPAIGRSDPLFRRVEAPSRANRCQADSDCRTSGCSGEVCAAEDVVSACPFEPGMTWPPRGARCGCVQAECIWYLDAR